MGDAPHAVGLRHAARLRGPPLHSPDGSTQLLRLSPIQRGGVRHLLGRLSRTPARCAAEGVDQLRDAPAREPFAARGRDARDSRTDGARDAQARLLLLRGLCLLHSRGA